VGVGIGRQQSRTISSWSGEGDGGVENESEGVVSLGSKGLGEKGSVLVLFLLQCVAVCCKMMQCTAACCSVLQRGIACCSVLRAASCSNVLLQHIAACWSALVS